MKKKTMKIGSKLMLTAFTGIIIFSLLAMVFFKPPHADEGYSERDVSMAHYHTLKVLAGSLAYKKGFIRGMEEEVLQIKDRYRHKSIPYSKWNPIEQERYNLGNWRITDMKKDYNTVAVMYMDAIASHSDFTKKETLPEGMTEPLPEKFELF